MFQMGSNFDEFLPFQSGTHPSLLHRASFFFPIGKDNSCLCSRHVNNGNMHIMSLQCDSILRHSICFLCTSNCCPRNIWSHPTVFAWYQVSLQYARIGDVFGHCPYPSVINFLKITTLIQTVQRILVWFCHSCYTQLLLLCHIWMEKEETKCHVPTFRVTITFKAGSLNM